MDQTKEIIENGEVILGIELGSTRIKAVLIDENHTPIASGDHQWENRLENRLWTYSLEDIWRGIRESYRKLKEDVFRRYGIALTNVSAIGISAMMHGYMAFDKDGELLAPFRTWRNGNTVEAAAVLTKLFQYNIPLRWSIAHLYQAILNDEEHVERIGYITTLAGYIHWQLTGQKVLGIGDASGMMPIDTDKKEFDQRMIGQFDELVGEKKYSWNLRDILPKVLVAGENAGYLTREGAKLLDESGELKAGIPLCPPEGDAGTGMTATNSVAKRTGNVSAGTSIFAMAVLEKELKKVYPEIDLVTTPDGSLVAMVHANNCTSDLDAWVGLFSEFARASGIEMDMNTIYGTLYRKALEGDPDCGGLLSYGYLSGENITGISEGRPLFVRSPESKFNLANFMRAHICSALGTLKIGMDILLKEEGVSIDTIMGHGGLFKTKTVGQKLLSGAIDAPVCVMETAGEGGPWGMALLASYMQRKDEGESLQDYLARKVFGGDQGVRVEPETGDVEGFKTFIERYKKGIEIEQAALDCLI